MLDITTAPNRYTLKSANLADAFTFAQHFETGEWVTLAAGNTVSRITGSSEITHLVTYPVITGSGRADVKFSRTLTLAQGDFEFVTDNFTSTPAISIGSELAVEGDGDATQARGRLTVAASGSAVRAICIDTDATASPATITCDTSAAGYIKA